MNLCMGCMSESNGASVCPVCEWKAGTKPDSPLHLSPGTVLTEQYVVGRVLGHGGFGITYLGWDLNLARKIAVKEYFPAGIAIRESGTSHVSAYSGNMQKDYQWGLDRYLDEARVLARFDHPNISSVINFFRGNGTAYMILDYLDGMTFEKFLDRRGGKASWQDVTRIMLPVMDALREVHKSSILHRDISPDNIYILKTGQVRVIDFGAARYALGQASKNLSIILKEGYAPEEQYRSKGNQGPWTDVYATAATMYRALTGKIPPPALDRQRVDELEPPSNLGVQIPFGKERVLLKALAVDARDRFQDMAEFENAILATTGPLDEAPVVPAIDELKAGAAAAAARKPITWDSAAPVLKPEHQEGAPSVIDREPEQFGSRINALKSLPEIDPHAPEAPTVPLNALGFDRPQVLSPSQAPVLVPPPPRPFPKWLMGGLAAFVLLVVMFVALKLSGGGPKITTFAAQPDSIAAGASAVLRWSVNNKDVESVSISPGIGNVAPDGTVYVQPSTTTKYTITARSRSGKESTETVQVTVTGSPRQAATLPEIADFNAMPSSIAAGQKAHLSWFVRNAEEVTLGGQAVQPEGRAEVTPTQTTTYTLVAKSASGATANRDVTITVTAATTQELRIVTFLFDPPMIQAGQTTRLRWSVQGADSVEIQGLGKVPAEGDREVRVPRTMSVALIASGGGHQAKQTAEITVTSAGKPRESTRTQTTQRPNGQPQETQGAIYVAQFEATPVSIQAGQPSLLSWSVLGATSVVITPMPGRVDAVGQVQIYPGRTTTYQLLATNAAGQQVTRTTTVLVGLGGNTTENTTDPFYRAPRNQQPRQAGGQSWAVLHDHDGFFTINLNRGQPQEWHYCRGQLSIVGNQLRYVSQQYPAHNFDAPLSSVSAKRLKRTIQGQRAFEVKINDRGHFNFISQTTDIGTIIDAINAAAR